MVGPDPSTGSELARLNRALRMLSDANQALIRATDLNTLLHEICRITVEVGGYPFAWIGTVPPGSGPSEVVPAAAAGVCVPYLAGPAPGSPPLAAAPSPRPSPLEPSDLPGDRR